MSWQTGLSTRGWKRTAAAFMLAAAAAVGFLPAPAGAAHLAPQTIETNDPTLYNEAPGAVLTATECPQGGSEWSGGSAQSLDNVTAHLAWTFTIPEGHTGVVSVVGLRDNVSRPFYFWMGANLDHNETKLVRPPTTAGAMECQATLASSATLPAGIHRVNVSGTAEAGKAFLDYFRLVTASDTGSLVINKVSDTPGTFDFTVNCPGAVSNQPVTVTVGTAGGAGTSSAPIAGIPTGTTCTVSETTAFGFVPQPAQNVTIASGTNTVSFTNVREAATPTTPTTPTTPGAQPGYWLVASDGGIFAFDAPFLGSTGAMRLAQPIVGMAPHPGAKGYWLVASDGGIFAFGDATFAGSTGAMRLAQPVVGMAPTPSGKGYWLVASDGGIFAFGDAAFFGSTGGMRLARPIVGMTPTPSGQGYWLVASDGGIFAFGDATFAGSTGAMRLAQPIEGMASTPSGKGYWLVASDGGIFAFGDATFAGSTGAMRLAQPIAGMASTPTGKGYWLVASDGGIFAFGDAVFRGSTGALRLARPVVGMAARQG